MKLSIIIPIYNEKNTVSEIVQKILSVGAEKEVILVDDGSTDGTTQIAEEICNKYRFKFAHHEKNKGKGAAIKTGLKSVTGDVVVIQDADLELEPGEYLRLLYIIERHKADVVNGSRFLGGGYHRVLRLRHYIGNKILTWYGNLLNQVYLTDICSGFKMFRVEAIKNINIEQDGFGVTPELMIKMIRGRCIIYETSVNYHWRGYAFGKKITWVDGIKDIWYITKYSLLTR